MRVEGVQDLGKEGVEFAGSAHVYVSAQEVWGWGKVPAVAEVVEGGAVEEEVGECGGCGGRAAAHVMAEAVEVGVLQAEEAAEAL